ncbi:MAG: ABC transporter ATP-binding protein [Lawsonibacter sp.]|nr:ABC transporter ATP-binding protein [Lawsonibacter sp.]
MPLLEVTNLSVSFDTPQGEVQAVRDVSFSVEAGQTLAIVGESGCGKSALCRSILKLLPPSARIKSGKILVDGRDVAALSEREACRLRGRLLSLVLQDPMAALDPTLPVGTQIAQAVGVHAPGLSRAQREARALELLELTGLPRARERARLCPHSLSGGMRQRAVLAAALAGSPRLLLADEPTTALDPTVRIQILDLLDDIRRKLNTAVVLVTHDLGAAARCAQRVAVMYAGKILETGTAEDIFYDPRHPYTRELLACLPALARPGEPLHTIPGTPPSPLNPPPGDPFAPRNRHALEIDFREPPPMFQVSPTHRAASWLLDPRASQAAFSNTR